MAIKLGNTDIEDAKLGSTQVDKIYLGDEVVWSKAAPVSIKALKFTSTGSQTLGVDSTKIGTINPNLEYSTDSGSTWTTWNIANTVSFGNGTDLYVRGTNTKLAIGGDNYLHFVFSTNSAVECSGNIMWLYDHTQDLTAFNNEASNRGLKYLFQNCTVLTKAPDLPATTLAYSFTYGHMFEGCTSLVTAPVLPALTLTQNCYDNMFLGCTNLEVIPALPASTFASRCYYCMFKDCTKVKMSLTQVDEYQNEYTLGGQVSAYDSSDMFANTGGTFSGGQMFQTIYTANQIIS